VAILNAFRWSTQTNVAVEGIVPIVQRSAHLMRSGALALKTWRFIVSAIKDRRGTISLCKSAGRM